MFVLYEIMSFVNRRLRNYGENDYRIEFAGKIVSLRQCRNFLRSLAKNSYINRMRHNSRNAEIELPFQRGPIHLHAAGLGLLEDSQLFLFIFIVLLISTALTQRRR